MTDELKAALDSLSPIQREAVNWNEGPVLVLAGPGAGKTRVLTTRLARLLDESPDRRFKVLALTFTTKAAAEMRERAALLVPGIVEERTFIGTFHAFCTHILQQHGSHIDIRPDFGIVGLKEEQEELLKDAIEKAIRQGRQFRNSDVSLLPAIKQWKSRIFTPQKVFAKTKNAHLKEVYELYEEALRAENVLDFEGLLLESCRLLSSAPAVAARIRQSYPYWMIDEFQDTTPAQSWLLHYLSDKKFKNLFVVADDDQIIYQWAGASYRQIEKFREGYTPELIQLVENHRCPPEIVGLANRLVAYNTQRAPEKQPNTAGRKIPLDAVRFRSFETDEEERVAITEEIVSLGETAWGNLVILGRTRGLLAPLLDSLRERGVRAVLSQRRDNFISPEFVWLQACLDQALRPANKRCFNVLVNAANRICGIEMDPALLQAEAESAGESYFEHWAKCVSTFDAPLPKKLGSLVQNLAEARSNWKGLVKEGIPVLIENARAEDGAISDADEDRVAWDVSMREIRSEIGHEPELSDLVQGIALRSKEPPREPNTAVLMTIHASKGLEFEVVYVVGLAEEEIPSWQSCKKGDASAEMEEERRNCFVAITRTQEKLNLSTARRYRNRVRGPSRFLKEMCIIPE